LCVCGCGGCHAQQSWIVERFIPAEVNVIIY
jgi:hypothetical protein